MSKRDDMRTCSTCDGTGRVQSCYCAECSAECDDDGYCDPCAKKAEAEHTAKHGSAADQINLRRSQVAMEHDALKEVEKAAREFLKDQGDPSLDLTLESKWRLNDSLAALDAVRGGK